MVKDLETVDEAGARRAVRPQVIIVDEFTGRHDAGPALVGRPARGGRGQGRHQDRAGEPDARHHHAAELLPDVRQARGHDGHGGDRVRGVRQDLRARRHGGPDQPRRSSRVNYPDVVYKTEREKFDAVSQRDRGVPREGPARARGHRLHREVRAALEAAQEARASRIRSSTPSTTSARPRSSPRPGARRR